MKNQISVKRLNHAVLYVRNLARSVDFYKKVFGFEEIAHEAGMMAFLRAKDSHNHHDLGLLEVGENAQNPREGFVGLYHLAWEVPKIEDLAEAQKILARVGALVGQSDHGATKSLYAKDPDGNEFEIMWLVPKNKWGDYDHGAPIMPLDLEKELERFGKK